MRTRAALLAVGMSALLGLGVLPPASAAGGPPTVTLSPTSVPLDERLTVAGTGCEASSPVSVRLYPTSGGTAFDENSEVTGWVASGSGAFSRGVALDARFPIGELGVRVSCTPIFDIGTASVPDFVFVAASNPMVDVSVAASSRFGSRPTVTVSTSDSPGEVQVRIDGNPAPLFTAATDTSPHTFRLPASLAVGSHSLEASFDPTPAGSATVTDTTTLAITKATATVKLARSSTAKIRAGKKVKVRLSIASVGPRTGTVVIKDGSKVRLTVVLRAADHGKKALLVKLPSTGKRKLTATYRGNASVTSATSPRLTVTVIK